MSSLMFRWYLAGFFTGISLTAGVVTVLVTTFASHIH